MTRSELLRLERVEVDGLFDIYDHRISLNLDDRVTLLHGPNGVGKTVVLRMVNALLQERFGYFRTIPFRRFLLGFHDGSTLVLSAQESLGPESGKYTLSLDSPKYSQAATVSLHASRAESVANQIDYLHPHNTLPETWVDIRDGEVLSASEIVDRFDHGASIPESYEEEDMRWLGAFLRNANAHLIEAQRLVWIDSESRAQHWYPSRHRTPPTISTVIERSRDFKRRLADTMAQYGRQSQTLDQSFPQRLISATDQLAEQELETHMSALDTKTTEFMAIGILDETPTHPFPVENLRELDPTQARVMTLYIRDTEQKLKALDDLAIRARLLLDNVNQKFRHKRIRMDREEGFVAESDTGKILSLSSLSSGEQHELVLHYDLLFRVPSNTIVLIDEPELSLHVAWQKRFLPDLLNIVKLSDFDALVATHSPFIIGDRGELMVGLGEAS